MNREYQKWFSPALNRDMELLIFGHGGKPYLVFPSSMGKFYEFEDRGMIGAAGQKIDAGHLRFFCVDSVDLESWYNRSAHPRDRVLRHIQYEHYILNEVAPLIRHRAGPAFGVTGASFGAYHCVNLALRNPWSITDCIAMSGAYDLHNFLNGYFDENAYFNCPTAFVPNLSDQHILSRIREMRIVLGAGDHDICLGETRRFSDILNHKGIGHSLQVWGERREHDWPLWQDMARAFY
jgi:esterase/lipase superfamily enzyme